MKRCPQGHMYPDSYPECPLCDSREELQTILGSSPARQTAAPPQAAQRDNLAHPPRDAFAVPGAGGNPEPGDLEKTVLTRRGAAASSKVLVGWLVEIDDTGQAINSHQLFSGRSTVGRHPENTIVLNEKTLSARHCYFDCRPGAMVLHDTVSSNGSFVDDQRVRGDSGILSETNVIALGNFKARIRYA